MENPAAETSNEKCVISDELEKIGWGLYQSYVFFIGVSALTLSSLWLEATAILMQEPELDSLFSTFLAGSLNSGMLIGCFLIGWLIGVYGREKIYKMNIICTSIGAVMCCIDGYMLFLGLFLVGLGVGGDIATSYTIFMECIPNSYISYLTLFNCGYCFGGALGAFLALILENSLTKEYKPAVVLIWICTGLSIVLAVCRMFVLESPVFLYDKVDNRVYDVLREIAKINKKEDYEPKFGLNIDPSASFIEFKGSIFKSPFLSLTIFQSFVYFFSTLCFYMLIFFMPGAFEEMPSTDVYELIISQQLGKIYAVGISGVCFASYSINGRLGRIGLQILSFAISGIFSIALIFSSNLLLKIITSGMLYVSMNSGISVLYTYTQEVYPSLIRGTGAGWATGVCNITALLSPFVIYQIQNNFSSTVVLEFIAFCFFASALFPVFLPETRVIHSKEN